MTHTPAPDAMPELKPCPFCGCDASKGKYYTACSGIKNEVYINNGCRAAQSHDLWNTRADHHTALEQVARQMAEALRYNKIVILDLHNEVLTMQRRMRIETSAFNDVNDKALAAYAKLMEGK